jgi:(R,R)-butanediol dehydrogenase/meso-butanediol dehydrogenase/diacetyl reductase
MKAVYYSREQGLVYGDLPDPEARPGEVLVRVHYVGICGSDLHLYKSRRLPDGAIMGHECSGTIEGRGEGVLERRVGDRVIVRPIGCGICVACAAGNEHLCPQRRAIGLGADPGGYADILSVSWKMTIPVPDLVRLPCAALTDPFATALHAIRQARPLQGKSVLIAGSGAIGLSLLLLLKRQGIAPILVSEPHPARGEAARELGADGVFHPKDPEVFEKIRSATGGLGPAAVCECSGMAEAFQQGLSWVAKTGEVILIGLGADPFPLLPLLPVLKEVRILGSFANTQDECREVLGMMARQEIPLARLTEDRIGLAELPGVFAELLAGSSRAKVIVEIKRVC